MEKKQPDTKTAFKRKFITLHTFVKTFNKNECANHEHKN